MGPHRNSCTIARFDGPIPGNPIVAASRVLRGRGHYTAVRLALRTKGRQGQHLPSGRCPNFLIMPPRPPALLQCSTRRARPERPGTAKARHCKDPALQRPGTAKTRFFTHKHAPRQHQIAAQGIEDVLPRTQSLRVPEGDRSITSSARTVSGKIPSAAQSPLPIALPARTEATLTL